MHCSSSSIILAPTTTWCLHCAFAFNFTVSCLAHQAARCRQPALATNHHRSSLKPWCKLPYALCMLVTEVSCEQCQVLPQAPDVDELQEGPLSIVTITFCVKVAEQETTSFIGYHSRPLCRAQCPVSLYASLLKQSLPLSAASLCTCPFPC